MQNVSENFFFFCDFGFSDIDEELIFSHFFQNNTNLILCATVRVKNKLYVFQNKIATKSKQNSNKIKTKTQNFCFDFVAVLF